MKDLGMLILSGNYEVLWGGHNHVLAARVGWRAKSMGEGLQGIIRFGCRPRKIFLEEPSSREMGSLGGSKFSVAAGI